MIDYPFNRIPSLRISKQWFLPARSKIGTTDGIRDKYDAILTGLCLSSGIVETNITSTPSLRGHDIIARDDILFQKKFI